MFGQEGGGGSFRYLIAQCFHLSLCQLFALVQLLNPLVQVLQRRFVLHDGTADGSSPWPLFLAAAAVAAAAADVYWWLWECRRRFSLCKTHAHCDRRPNSIHTAYCVCPVRTSRWETPLQCTGGTMRRRLR